MDMDKIIGHVYETYDYDKFKKLLGNRDVKHASAIEQSVKENGQLTIPIICNEKMQIIDGQNRFDAWKSAGLPIFYIICEGYGIEQCIAMNTTAQNWSVADYINCYADYGYSDYATLKQLESEYQERLSATVVRCAAYGSLATSPLGIIKRGKFKLGKSEQEIRKELDYLMMFEIPKSIRGNAKLLYSIIRFCYVFEEVDNARLIRQWDKCQGQIRGITDIKQAAEAVENVYNFGKAKKAYCYIATEYRKYAQTKCSVIPGHGESSWDNE